MAHEPPADLPPVPGNPIPLHVVAKQLKKATHVLVSASRLGHFPPVVKVGHVWYVSADAVAAWFARQHATNDATEGQRDRIRQAGRGIGGPRPRRPRSLPRASTAPSS